MRTLLHAPRTRKRSIAAATLGALALVGSLLVATPAHAINDTGTGGVFVPASGRVLDTKAGTGGFSTPMEAGKYRTIKIAGVAGIPDDGTVGAVSLNATVSGTPSAGTLFGRPDADTSRTTMIIYNANAGEYVSNTAIVAVSVAGTIQVSTETAARLILDVQGYYTANTDGTAAGGFVPVAGKRIVDTRSGLGAQKALLAPGKSVDIQVTGANGVPAGASGAVVNLLPINSTGSDGYLTPYATGTTRPDNALHYAPSVNTSIQAQVQLSSSGKMTIYNGSSTINLVIDLQGYFTAAGTTGATFTPGVGRVFDSRASDSSILAKNETRAIQVAGQAGVPVMGSGITAVVLTLTAVHGGSDGRASVWANGTTQPDTTAINFQADEIRTNTVTVAIGANGKINLDNVAAATHYVIDVQGWYVDPSVPAIACPNPYSAGSWTHITPASVTCTVTSPPAANTGEYVEITTPTDSQDVTLSATGRSVTAVTFTPQAGVNDIYATLVSAEGDVVVENSIALGFGDWSKTALTLSPASAETRPLPLTLSVVPGDEASFLDDTVVQYSISTTVDMANILWVSDNTASGTIVPDGLLTAGSTYYWAATVSGSTDWSGTSATLSTAPRAVTISAMQSTLTADQEASARTQMTDLGIASAEQDALIVKINAGSLLNSSDPGAEPVRTDIDTSVQGQTTTLKVFADGSRSSITVQDGEAAKPQGVQVRAQTPTKSGCKSSAGWKNNCKIEIKDIYSWAHFYVDYKTSSKGAAALRTMKKKECWNVLGGCSVWGKIKRSKQSGSNLAWAELNYKCDIVHVGSAGQGAFGIQVGKSVTLY